MTTREGALRVCRRAFEIARTRTGAPADGVRRVTCVDKSNVLRSHALFREIFERPAAALRAALAAGGACIGADGSARGGPGAIADAVVKHLPAAS